ncbi:MAG: hypothetical protein HHJ16_13625 [Polaromonas sp.]|uniref:hypothetical protein n=1 Tax=Polaromonas sp. TaxID=1869339 RepID=UPI0017B53E2B|nr:hypothetical protein [Polaromonas sp.]NMM11296.1 hypothetical protein [Polaromonas sp.]
MSSSANPAVQVVQNSSVPAQEQDPVEAIVPMIPLVLPLVGGILIFLLAFIAVFMA